MSEVGLVLPLCHESLVDSLSVENQSLELGKSGGNRAFVGWLPLKSWGFSHLEIQEKKKKRMIFYESNK